MFCFRFAMKLVLIMVALASACVADDRSYKNYRTTPSANTLYPFGYRGTTPNLRMFRFMTCCSICVLCSILLTFRCCFLRSYKAQFTSFIKAKIYVLGTTPRSVGKCHFDPRELEMFFGCVFVGPT